MAAQVSQVEVVHVVPEDYPALSRLEDVAFANDEFGKVAFGPNRRSEAALDSRAASLAALPKTGDIVRNVKAVRIGPTGKEEIVGYAGWVFCVGRTGSEEEKEKLGTKEAWAQESPPGDEPFGPGANVKFCLDTFVAADRRMARSTGGYGYAKLRMLVVKPECQRMGIGAKLLEEGLREVDRQGLQSMLGASPHGIGLYRKHGYVEFATKEYKLWMYDGGEGLGTVKHVVMHRPATTK